jgi:intein/homing endonuclease
VAGTPLLTVEGDKAIELFHKGDRILSRSEFDPDGPLEVKLVEEVFVRVAPILTLIVEGRIIRTTAEHPFYLLGQGWRCAKELQAGDWLISHERVPVRLEEVRQTAEVATVYNLRVADYHTYFVGSREWGFSVWAHNAEYTIVKLREGGVTIVDSEGKVMGGLASRNGGPGFADEAAARAWAKDNIEAGNTVGRDLRRKVTTPAVDAKDMKIVGSTQSELFEGDLAWMKQQLKDNPQQFWKTTVERDGKIKIIEIDGKRYLENGNHRWHAASEAEVPIPEWAIQVEVRTSYGGQLTPLDQMTRMPGGR